MFCHVFPSHQVPVASWCLTLASRSCWLTWWYQHATTSHRCVLTAGYRARKSTDKDSLSLQTSGTALSSWTTSCHHRYVAIWRWVMGVIGLAGSGSNLRCGPAQVMSCGCDLVLTPNVTAVLSTTSGRLFWWGRKLLECHVEKHRWRINQRWYRTMWGWLCSICYRLGRFMLSFK